MNVPSFMVRMKGLEPPRLTPLDPKSSVATNYTTSASVYDANIRSFLILSKYRLFLCHSSADVIPRR